MYVLCMYVLQQIPSSGCDIKVVEPRLNKISLEFSIPEVLHTDNGPSLDGKDFAHFAQTPGFKHCKVTPLGPPAKSEVEHFMLNITKPIEARYQSC